MIIKSTDRIYNAEGEPVPHRYHGLRREEFNGKSMEDLRTGGHDWYIYQQPEGHDSSINKLDGVVTFDTLTCTEGVTDLTPEELEERLNGEALLDNLPPLLYT